MSHFLIDGSNEAEVMARMDKAFMRDAQHLDIVHSDYYKRLPQNDLSLWCLNRGFYCLPTYELIEWLKNEIGYVNDAIEIGSGNGAIGRALGIPRTDSKMQERPKIMALYESAGQGVVKYGADVETLTAGQAVAKYKPSVVVAAWVTHRYDPKAPRREGNMWGVSEEKILSQVGKYIFVGHERVHAKKPILRVKHKTYRFPWLVSRSPDPRNVIWVWS